MIILTADLTKVDAIETNKVISGNTPVLFNLKDELNELRDYKDYKDASITIGALNIPLVEKADGFLMNAVAFTSNELGEQTITLNFTDAIRNNVISLLLNVFIADSSKFTNKDIQEANENPELYNLMKAQVSQEGGSGGGGASTFLELTDTPGTYEGFANAMVVVNGTENGLTTVPQPVSPVVKNNLIELNDTPVGYGTAGQVLATNGTADGTEWVDQSGGGGSLTKKEHSFNNSNWIGKFIYQIDDNGFVDFSIRLESVGGQGTTFTTLTDALAHPNLCDTAIPCDFRQGSNYVRGFIVIDAYNGQTHFRTSDSYITGALSDFVMTGSVINAEIENVVSYNFINNISFINTIRIKQGANFVDLNTADVQTWKNVELDFTALDSAGFINTAGEYTNVIMEIDGEYDDGKKGPAPFTASSGSFTLNSNNIQKISVDVDGMSQYITASVLNY